MGCPLVRILFQREKRKRAAELVAPEAGWDIKVRGAPFIALVQWGINKDEIKGTCVQSNQTAPPKSHKRRTGVGEELLSIKTCLTLG